MTIFGVANFGHPQLQYDTFDLTKLPSGSVIETAAAPQIKTTPCLAVESESSPRSTDNSAERECACRGAIRLPDEQSEEPCEARSHEAAREPHGSEFFTSQPGSQPKVRSGHEDGCMAPKSVSPDNVNGKPPRFLQLKETTANPGRTKTHAQRTSTTAKSTLRSFTFRTCVYF